MLFFPLRRNGRAVEGGGLENHCTRKGTGGSNPPSSVFFLQSFGGCSGNCGGLLLRLLHDETASVPPRASSPAPKTRAREPSYFCHGLPSATFGNATSIHSLAGSRMICHLCGCPPRSETERRHDDQNGPSRDLMTERPPGQCTMCAPEQVADLDKRARKR